MRDDPYPEGPKMTKMGCQCLDSYTWEGMTITDGQCTSYDWPVPWCAVPQGCVSFSNPKCALETE
jgi:hypothetical protein